MGVRPLRPARRRRPLDRPEDLRQEGVRGAATNLALEAAQGEQRPLRHPLALVYTYDEEVGTLGARYLMEGYPGGGLLPRNAVIGEPTSLRVARAHKGHLKLRITLSGVSAHSGYPHLGVNAIEPVGRIVVALTQLRQELEAEHPPHRELFPEVPFVPLNLATLHGVRRSTWSPTAASWSSAPASRRWRPSPTSPRG